MDRVTNVTVGKEDHRNIVKVVRALTFEHLTTEKIFQKLTDSILVEKFANYTVQGNRNFVPLIRYTLEDIGFNTDNYSMHRNDI